MSFSSENVIFDVRRISKLPILGKILCKLACYITTEFEEKSVNIFKAYSKKKIDKNWILGNCGGGFSVLSSSVYTHLYIVSV